MQTTFEPCRASVAYDRPHNRDFCRRRRKTDPICPVCGEELGLWDYVYRESGTDRVLGCTRCVLRCEAGTE